MAKTIRTAALTINHASGTAHNHTVIVTVECPVSEYQALLDIADLTNAIPAGQTTTILAAGDAGASQ